MFTHVLIPLDGSVLAEKAAKVAPNILPPQCKITLLMVVAASADSGQSDAPNAVQEARDYLEHVASWLKLKSYEVDTELQAGDPAEAIVNYAHHSNIDAIIMCTRVRSGLERGLFGRVTRKVLNRARCPAG